MNTFTLSFKDPVLRELYQLSRSKDVLRLSVLVLILRLLMMVVLVIYMVKYNFDFSMKTWLNIGGSIGWQILIIGVTWKFPKIFSALHAPLLSLNLLLIIYIFFDLPPFKLTLVNIFMYYIIFQLSVITLNFAWILSSISLSLNTASLMYILE